jgi:hypothetical protein
MSKNKKTKIIKNKRKNCLIIFALTGPLVLTNCLTIFSIYSLSVKKLENLKANYSECQTLVQNLQGAREVAPSSQEAYNLYLERKKELTVQLVEAQPDVREWLKHFDKNRAAIPAQNVKSRAIIEFNHSIGQIYVIHVYEVINDKGANRQATFKWYDVDIEKKTVSEEII